MRAAELAPPVLRAALCVVVLVLPLEPVPYAEVVRLFAVPFALGFLLRVFTTTLWVRLVWAAFAAPGGPAVNGELLGLAAMCTALFMSGAGPWSLDARLAARAPRLARPMPAYVGFVLRVGLALALVTQGLLLLLFAPLLYQALGLAWLAWGAALALGVFTGWAALTAAPLLLLGAPFDPALAPLAMGAVALALLAQPGERIAFDPRLERRGGLFPTLRREVVLEERGGRP
jgi:hypothetical protein